jgi:uncharacterized protein (TIGR03067 family)
MIRLLALGAVLAASLPSGAASQETAEAIRRDREFIAGMWRVVRLEVGGQPAREEDARKLTVTNAADGAWILYSAGDEISRGTSTIDPAVRPRHIDFVATAGPGAGERRLGIYEYGETSRRLCFAPAGQPRPEDFGSTAANGHILVEFVRE